jgi:hypothetical protein
MPANPDLDRKPRFQRVRQIRVWAVNGPKKQRHTAAISIGTARTDKAQRQLTCSPFGTRITRRSYSPRLRSFNISRRCHVSLNIFSTAIDPKIYPTVCLASIPRCQLITPPWPILHDGCLPSTRRPNLTKSIPGLGTSHSARADLKIVR